MDEGGTDCRVHGGAHAAGAGVLGGCGGDNSGGGAGGAAVPMTCGRCTWWVRARMPFTMMSLFKKLRIHCSQLQCSEMRHSQEGEHGILCGNIPTLARATHGGVTRRSRREA